MEWNHESGIITEVLEGGQASKKGVVVDSCVIQSVIDGQGISRPFKESKDETTQLKATDANGLMEVHCISRNQHDDVGKCDFLHYCNWALTIPKEAQSTGLRIQSKECWSCTGDDQYYSKKDGHCVACSNAKTGYF